MLNGIYTQNRNSNALCTHTFIYIWAVCMCSYRILQFKSICIDILKSIVHDYINWKCETHADVIQWQMKTMINQFSSRTSTHIHTHINCLRTIFFYFDVMMTEKRSSLQIFSALLSMQTQRIRNEEINCLLL